MLQSLIPTRRAVLSAVLALSLAGFAAAAHSAGKPEKAFLEGKFHMLIPGLRNPTLRSRVVGNQLYAEHVRDVRVAPGVLRYMQSVPLSLYDLRSSYDSVSELHFEDFERAKAAFESDEIRVGDGAWTARLTGGIGAGVRPWRPNSKGIVIVRDHVLVDGYEQGYKWFSFMRRKEGVAKEQVDTYMREKYAPALAKLPGIRRYVLGVTYRPKGADAAGGMWGPPQNYDAVDMIWFHDLQAMQRLLGSIDYQENVQRAAEVAVIDQSQTVSFAAESHERVPFRPRYEGPTWEEMKPANVPPKGAAAGASAH